jgi:RNA recognition motif-containing protein
VHLLKKKGVRSKNEREGAEDRYMNQNRLFVGNLSYQTMENDLQDYFSQAGVVTSVNLMLDKVTGKSRGFAFVEFATPEEAGKAVEQFHNQEFQGRTLTVNVARPREERAPRRGSSAGADRADSQ